MRRPIQHTQIGDRVDDRSDHENVAPEEGLGLDARAGIADRLDEALRHWIEMTRYDRFGHLGRSYAVLQDQSREQPAALTIEIRSDKDIENTSDIRGLAGLLRCRQA